MRVSILLAATILLAAADAGAGGRFLMGWYDAATHPETAAQVAAQGIDVLVPYVSTLSAEAIAAYVAAAEAAGLKVILEVPRSIVKDGDTTGLAAYITRLRRPSVIGWYLFDEPDRTAGVSHGSIRKAFDTIKAAPSSLPVSLALVTAASISTYADACDAIWYDYYPISAGSREFAPLRGEKYRKRLQQMTDLIRSADREPWLILQGFGEDRDGNPQYGRRSPTVGEMRYMLYTALLQRPAGILFWTHYRAREEWVEEILTPLVREVRRIVPDDLQAFDQPMLSTANGALQLAVLGSTVGKRYLVAVHHGARAARIAVQSEREMAVSEIGGGKLTLGRSTMLDFSPFQVRVFELLP
jgi:hypothetical protein